MKDIFCFELKAKMHTNFFLNEFFFKVVYFLKIEWHDQDNNKWLAIATHW